ncbi:cellulosomal scaffoldin anchoring protein [Echinococcus multilocularis]|uniref:Cellulosomal scaffoldin anchoring protein n=1 Tax=Echinococcus multilocularis TaxID=6211 RepID=A0A068Y0V3_ECHMU|nr:cellulosomal scaffoldin anchoring protein [Echinococcus multilocularis]
MTLRGYIVILKRDGTSGSFCDWRADRCIFGSDGSCDVRIKLDTVAPLHCKLERMADGRVFVENLSKITKTFLNGVPVTERTFVAHDSLLTVVDRNFKFLYPENSAYIFKSALSGTKKGVPLSPMLRSSPRCISDVSSFATVMSSSPKHSPLQSTRVKTPTLSSQRRALSTKERYGPTPTRPVATPPVVNVVRHSLKRRSSKTDKYQSPTRKRAKTNVSETPITSGSPSVRPLRSSSASKEGTLQTNNSSYYSLNTDQTAQFDLFDVSSKSLNASSTLLSSGKSKANVLQNVRFAGDLELTPDARKKSPTSPASLHETSTNKRMSRNSLIRRSFSDSTAPDKSTLAEATCKFNSRLSVEIGTPPKGVYYGQEVAKSRPSKSGNHLDRCRVVKKGVQFGPSLSPEQFDSRLPPSTPIKRGELPPPSSLQRIYTSIVKHRRSTSLPLTLKTGHNVSTQLPKPQNASFGLETKSTPRGLPRNLVDSSIDDSTAPLRNSASGNLDASASDLSYATLTKPTRLSNVSSFELADTGNDQSSKRQSIVTNGSNVDTDNESSSHVTSPLFPPMRSDRCGKSSVEKVPSRHRRSVGVPFHRSAGRTSAIAIELSDTALNGRRGRSPPSSKLIGRLSPPSSTSNSRHALDLQALSSVTPFALQSSVQQLHVENTSLSNSSSPEVRFETMDTLNVPLPDSLPGVHSSTNTPKVQSSSRISITRRLMRTSRTAPSPILSGAQETINMPTSPHSDIGIVLPSQTSPALEIQSYTRLSGSLPPMNTSEVQDLPRLSGIREPVKTSRSVLSPRLSGVRKLVKTAEVPASPILLGIREIIKTPKSVSSPRLSAVRRLVKTPNAQASPRLSGLRKLVKTPMIQASQELSGIRKLMETPRPVPPQRLSDVRRLMKTPKVQASPELSGIRKLVKTPKSVPSPRLSGVRKLVKTPKIQASPELSGIRKLMKTPKSVPSPRLSGVRRLVKTPKIQASPQLSGIGELINTPKSVPSPSLSGVQELVGTLEVNALPNSSETRAFVNAPMSPPFPRLSGLHDLVNTLDASNSDITPQKNATSRPKRLNATQLSSLGERRRLLKSKADDASQALPSEINEVRQTRSRTKTSTLATDTLRTKVVANLDAEAKKIQRKRGGRTKSVLAKSMKSNASTAQKRQRKQLSPVSEPLSHEVKEIVQRESVSMRVTRSSKAKLTKGVKGRLSPHHLARDSPVLPSTLHSEGDGKDTASTIRPSKKGGNRKTGSSPRDAALNSSPLLSSTDLEIIGVRTVNSNTSAVTGTPPTRRKRHESSWKSPSPKSTLMRRSKRTAPRNVAVNSSVGKKQVRGRKKVQFADPEIIDTDDVASTFDEGEGNGGATAAAARRRCGASSRHVAPGEGIPRPTRKRSAATSSRRNVATSPSLKPIWRGRAKK